MEERLPFIQSWLRLPRDWHADPRLVRAADEAGIAAAAGYVILLGRACASNGTFESLQAVADAVRSDGVALGIAEATKAATALIRAGLIVSDGDRYLVADWASYRPPANMLPSRRRLTPPSGRASGRASGGEPDRERDRGREKIEGGETAATVEVDGIETMILPAIALPSRERCSHGVAFRTKTLKDGRAIITADHEIADGTWCRDRQPAAGAR